MKNIRRTIQKLQIHTLLTHTLVTLPLTQPLHTNYLPHASPNSNYTPDQSWPKPNWTDPIYALTKQVYDLCQELVEQPLLGFRMVEV